MKNQLTRKEPMLERLRAGGEGGDGGWDVGWDHRLNGHEFEQTLGVGDGQGSLVCCRPWGRKESDMTERLNNINKPFWKGTDGFRISAEDKRTLTLDITHLPRWRSPGSLWRPWRMATCLHPFPQMVSVSWGKIWMLQWMKACGHYTAHQYSCF